MIMFLCFLSFSCRKGDLVEGTANKSILLEALDINKIEQGKSRPQQIGEHAHISINNRRYLNGFHSRTESNLYLEMDGKVKRFIAEVGVEDRSTIHREDPVDKRTSYAEFFVIGDGNILWESGTMKYGEDSKPIDVNLLGVKTLLLKAVGGPGNTHVSWANGLFYYSGECPRTVWSPEKLEVIKSSEEFVENLNMKYPEPRINGTMVVGIRPNTPFYYPVAVTGMRPVTIEAGGLPEGLKLDKNTGIITGIPVKAGDYEVELRAENNHGKAQRTLKISVGDKLALTPPMGYLSWNVVEGLVSETFFKELADAFVNFGFRDVGYQYINIDDCWQGIRDSCGRITADPVRFPHGMKLVGDYLHDKGLKFGIYSTPGPITCAGFPGTMNFEELDVETWVSWGVDYLKHDGCSTPPDRRWELYSLMGRLLEKSGRSIVYSGSGKKEAGSQLWRIGGDLRDQWSGISNHVGIIQSFETAQKRAGEHEPGGWNDPDMLVVGIRGKGASGNDLTDESGCSNTEYRSHMSLWALMSAPLFITVDVRQIDPVSLEILTNPEVIDVNQDPLGRFPVRVGEENEQEVWVKDMEDGSKTVALFNKGSEEQEITVNWEDLELKGNCFVRDLWQRENIGEFKDSFASPVPSHGVVLIRVYSCTI
jgi:alpha-galactosidase